MSARADGRRPPRDRADIGRSGPGQGRWFCYVLECADGTLYTGVTTCLERRLVMHNRGRASRYTRSRLPVTLAYAEPHGSRSSASRREAQVKRMSRTRKLALARRRGATPRRPRP